MNYEHDAKSIYGISTICVLAGVINGQYTGPQCLNRNKKIFTKVISLFAFDVVEALKAGEVKIYRVSQKSGIIMMAAICCHTLD